jgi:hypothetical protein
MAVDLKQLGRSLNYQASAPVSAILADLQAIAEFDKVAETEHKRYGKLLIWAIAIAVGGAILLFGGYGGYIVWLGLIALAIGTGGIVFAGLRLSKYGRWNLPDSRYQLASQTLEMVMRDMDAAAPVQLSIDLNSALQAHKRTETVTHPTRQGWKIDRFTDSWLALNGEFLDGTRFFLKFTEFHLKQYGWKRGRSGKSKYKTKTKAKAGELELVLTCSRKKYGAIALLENDALGAIKLPSLVQLKQLKVTDNRLTLVVKTPAWFESSQIRGNQVGGNQADTRLYQTIAMMLLSLYQILNLAHLLSKSKTQA